MPEAASARAGAVIIKERAETVTPHEISSTALLRCLEGSTSAAGSVEHYAADSQIRCAPRHLAQAFDWTQERVPAFVYLVGDVLL